MKIQFLLLSLFFLYSCKRYKDPDPFTDPRIKNKYCNIPSAINYNWDFPGIPNDSVCIFPAQIYNGTYLFHDSIFNSTGLWLKKDSFILNFIQIDTTRMKIIGFCSSDTIRATATRYYKFTIDSLIGNGQKICAHDTIAGNGYKVDLNDTNTIKLSYTVATDTGIVYHAGTAVKQ